MNKKQLLTPLSKGAKTYQKFLLGRSFLFIGQGEEKGQYLNFEVLFEKSNYMHLTGCKIKDGYSADQFFDLCISQRMELNLFTYVPEAFVKVSMFESIFSLPYSARMLGNFAGSGNFLYTEKLAGSVRGCMGFVLGDNAPYYSPNTVLQADIRDLAVKPHKILAVYQKAADAPLYDPLPVSTAKELRRKTLVWPKDIACKIAMLPDASC